MHAHTRFGIIYPSVLHIRPTTLKTIFRARFTPLPRPRQRTRHNPYPCNGQTVSRGCPFQPISLRRQTENATERTARNVILDRCSELEVQILPQGPYTRHGPIVQRLVRRSHNPPIEVRFLVGPPEPKNRRTARPSAGAHDTDTLKRPPRPTSQGTIRPDPHPLCRALLLQRNAGRGGHHIPRRRPAWTKGNTTR